MSEITVLKDGNEADDESDLGKLKRSLAPASEENLIKKARQAALGCSRHWYRLCYCSCCCFLVAGLTVVALGTFLVVSGSATEVVGLIFGTGLACASVSLAVIGNNAAHQFIWNCFDDYWRCKIVSIGIEVRIAAAPATYSDEIKKLVKDNPKFNVRKLALQNHAEWLKERQQLRVDRWKKKRFKPPPCCLRCMGKARLKKSRYSSCSSATIGICLVPMFLFALAFQSSAGSLDFSIVLHPPTLAMLMAGICLVIPIGCCVVTSCCSFAGTIGQWCYRPKRSLKRYKKHWNKRLKGAKKKIKEEEKDRNEKHYPEPPPNPQGLCDRALPYEIECVRQMNPYCTPAVVRLLVQTLLCVCFPILVVTPVVLAMINAEDLDWAVAITNQNCRNALMNMGIFTSLASAIFTIFSCSSKRRRAPRNMARNMNRGINRFQKYEDVFAGTDAVWQQIPKRLLSSGERQVAKEFLADRKRKMRGDSVKVGGAGGGAAAAGAEGGGAEGAVAESGPAEDLERPWLDTKPFTEKMLQKMGLNTKGVAAEMGLTEAFVRNAVFNSPDKGVKELNEMWTTNASDFMVSAMVGEYPLWSLGNGIITKGLRSRRCFYLYQGTTMKWPCFLVSVFVLLIFPILIAMPIVAFVDVKQFANLDKSLGDAEWTQNAFSGYAVMGPLCFVAGYGLRLILGVVPNPFKAAFLPVVSWIVVTTAGPLLVVGLILSGKLEFDPLGAHMETEYHGESTPTLQMVAIMCMLVFPVANISTWVPFCHKYRKPLKRWWQSVAIEQRFLSKPAEYFAKKGPYVTVPLPILQLIFSGLMFLQADGQVSFPAVVTTLYVVCMFTFSSFNIIVLFATTLGATRRNLVGSEMRAALEAVAPQMETLVMLFIFLFEAIKLGYSLFFLIQSFAGLRVLNGVDGVFNQYLTIVVMIGLGETILFTAIFSRLYLVTKFKRRFGYHPAPFEEIVPTALSLKIRTSRQDGDDKDTDSDVSGLGSGLESSIWSEESDTLPFDKKFKTEDDSAAGEATKTTAK